MAFSSQLGTVFSVPGSTLLAGLPSASSPDVITVTASNTITFSQLAVDGTTALSASNTITFTQLGAFDTELSKTASNTITFTQVADRTGEINRTAENTIAFTQSDDVRGPVPVTADNALSLSQSSDLNLFSLTANNQITFSNAANLATEKELSASNTLTLTQSASPGAISRTAVQSITFEQNANRIPQVVNAIALTASNTVTFSQSNNRIHCLVTATALTASTALSLSSRGFFPIELDASNSVSFSNSADANPGKSVTQEVEFTQSVILNQVRSITASNTITFQHGFTYAQERGGAPVFGSGGCDITRVYGPLAGGDSDPDIRPVAPALDRKTDVVFFYPTGPVCSASSSITLRTPNFGDRDRNQYNRINRESRGGALRIFRDPDWPSQRTLVMDFSGIKDDEVDNILDFLDATLGLEVGFRDWHSRVWSGIIVTPDASVVRQGTNRNDLSIEMEIISESVLDVNACSELNLSQSNAVVVGTP